MKRKLRTLPVCAFALLTVATILMRSATTVRAAEAVKVEVKKSETKEEKVKKWESVITAGVTLTRGNSKNFLASGAFATKRTWTHDEMLFGANAGYGQNTTKDSTGTQVDTTTDSYVKGYGQWNHLFSPQTYAGLRVTGEHDDVAALAYRTTLSPLLGYYFVKQTNASLSAE